MTTIVKSAAIALMVAGALLCPTDLSSCGPFFRQAVFSFAHQPGQPLTDQIGILKPSYPRLYLYQAYRQLTSPLTPDEKRALLLSPASEANTTSTDEWLKARGKVPGLPKAPNIDVTVTKSTPTDYVQYTNCLDDALHSAAATLTTRLAKWNSAQVKDWIGAQDLVFANCNGGNPLQIPPAATDPQLKTDRAYQIAAAYFYANQLDEAERRFRLIAADKTSSWSDLSCYLLARVQIRQGTLQNDPSAMAKAQAQLQAILADPSRKAVHAPSRDLLQFVRARLDPPGRLAELGQVLVKPDSTLSRDLTDYRFLFDKLESAALPTARDELTDWLYTFHNQNTDHALAVWRSQHTLPWLLASIVSLNPGNTKATDLIQAADELRPDSPAFLTAAFHSIRLLLDSNPQQARARLDGILKDAKLNLSDKNLFYAERMKVAASWPEFLKYAQRVPVGESSDTFEEVKAGSATLDADSALVLNEHTPLKLIASAANDATVSLPLRANIAMAAWTRAVLSDDEAVAAQMTPLVPFLSGYAAETEKNRRQFAAVLLILKNPGLHPYADTGLGRVTEVNKIDDYRDNWWCSFSSAQREEQFFANFYQNRAELGQLKLLYPNSTPKAAFLSAADQAAGDADWKKLAALPAAPTYLSAAVVTYAQAHLDDPRVPEALALAVRSTRYGCTDSGTGKVSKQAYDLLHAQFPRSAAAARTKYWYK